MMRSALILARSIARLDGIRSALESLEYVPRSVNDLATGELLIASLEEGIKAADLVLVVWDTPRLSRAVMFEAGFALGLKAQMAVIDGRQGSSAAKDDIALDVLLPLPRMHAPLGDPGLLRQELQAFIDVVAESGTSFLVEPQRHRKAGAQFDDGTDYERRAVAALKRADGLVTAGRGGPRDVPDFLVSFPGLEGPFNPVLVELAGRRALLSRKIEQLNASAVRSRSRLGVLITLDEEQQETRRSGDFAVVTISLDRLENAPQSLASDLRTARNYLVHGRG